MTESGSEAGCGRPLTAEEEVRFRPTTNRADALARLRRFLAVAEDGRFAPDGSPMWLAGGIVLFWGDLRRLAEEDADA